MDFYLVEDTGPFQYDTTRAAVIYAESPQAAKAMFEESATRNSCFGGGPLRAHRIRQDGKRRVVLSHVHFA